MAALHQFLFKPADKTARSRLLFWLLLSLVVATICPLLALQKAFSSEFVIQDDARQHVFWMSRFLDPGLFPGDLIADYFQSVAPWGYASFYQIFAWVGISPLLLHRCLPIVLYWITTAYAFGVGLQFLPIPFAAFLSTVLLNQSLWMRDDLISSTPVAFVYPLFLAFLYYLLRRSLLPCLVVIALQGLFYPQCLLIYAGVLPLQVLKWQQGRVQWSDNRRDYWLTGLGLGVAVLVLLPYALKSSAFGSVLERAEARSLFTLSEQGWSDFFNDRPWEFWFCGKRSGMLPFEWCTANSIFSPAVDDLVPHPWRIVLMPPVWLALSLPWLLKWSNRFPLASQVRQIRLLPQIAIVSVTLFFISHALLFKLHLPNRYTEHSLRIITPLAAGVALTILLDVLLKPRVSVNQTQNRSWWYRGTAIGLSLFMLLYPVLLRYEDVEFPVIQYSTGRYPNLYRFFAAQPKDTVIASLAREINSIPSFAQRSILVGGRGFVLPYHLGYYREISQRTIDLIQAQYSSNLSQVQQFIQTYGVDFWLLEEQAFRPKYFSSNPVFTEFADATAQIEKPLRNAALAKLTRSCAVFRDGNMIVVESQCILDRAS